MTIHDYLEENILLLTVSPDENTVKLLDYRFHWQDKDGKIIRRWDNARHHPELRTFPHHMHKGEEGIAQESVTVNLADIFKILESEIDKH